MEYISMGRQTLLLWAAAAHFANKEAANFAHPHVAVELDQEFGRTILWVGDSNPDLNLEEWKAATPKMFVYLANISDGSIFRCKWEKDPNLFSDWTPEMDIHVALHYEPDFHLKMNRYFESTAALRDGTKLTQLECVFFNDKHCAFVDMNGNYYLDGKPIDPAGLLDILSKDCPEVELDMTYVPAEWIYADSWV